MNSEETFKLLEVAQAFDNRTIDDRAVIAWSAVLAELDYEDCLAAVLEHFKTSEVYLMPIHVRQGAQAAARERAARSPQRFAPGCWGVPATADIAQQIRALPGAPVAVDEEGRAKVQRMIGQLAVGMSIPSDRRNPAGEARDIAELSKSDAIYERARMRAAMERRTPTGGQE